MLGRIHQQNCAAVCCCRCPALCVICCVMVQGASLLLQLATLPCMRPYLAIKARRLAGSLSIVSFEVVKRCPATLKFKNWEPILLSTATSSV
jgi:hypothetical protein